MKETREEGRDGNRRTRRREGEEKRREELGKRKQRREGKGRDNEKYQSSCSLLTVHHKGTNKRACAPF